MQTSSHKFLMISLALATLLGGCKKNQKNNRDDQKSFFSKSAKGSSTPRAASSSDAQPFDLDSDNMKTFALDDSLPKHQSAKADASAAGAPFSWEDLTSEESRQQFKPLYFDFDKDLPKPGQEKALHDDIHQAKHLIKNGKLIVIEGHACHSAGSAIYNLAISEKRARNIAQEFAAAGIASSDIKIAPRGQEMPVKKGGNKQQQAVNRRVEIFAIDKN